ncbi:MAG: hypothetical protein NTW29_10650 [Bacteroidetes bacterium]|nr:hypothetical protein [Bacteroidota bacterium]
MKRIIFTWLTFTVILNVTAQVKVGSQPTVITSDTNLEVEATDGTKMVVKKANGFVGIITTTPNYPLSLGAGIGNTKLAIWDGGAVPFNFGFGVQPNEFLFNIRNFADKFTFNILEPSKSTLMTLNGRGNLGIGVNTPTVKLDVNGYIKVGSSDTFGDAAPQNGMIRYNSGTGKFQGYASGAWVNLH